MFGNGGGPFIITISPKGKPSLKKVVGLHPKLVRLELVKGKPRIWSYWHSSAFSGSLLCITLDGKFEEEYVTLLSNSENSFGSEVFDVIFSKHKLLTFNFVENYQVPAHPTSEWGN